MFIDASDHTAGFNAAQIAATRVSVVWAGAGAVANPAGRLKLDGALGTGEVPPGPGEVAIGRDEDGALVPLQGPATPSASTSRSPSTPLT